MTWTFICQILSHASFSEFLAGFSRWTSAQQFYDWRKIERANERLTKNRTNEQTIDEKIGFYVYGARVKFNLKKASNLELWAEFCRFNVDASSSARARASWRTLHCRAKLTQFFSYFSRWFLRFFRDFFVCVRTSFEVFRLVRTSSDVFGCIRMHLDAFGCTGTRSEISEILVRKMRQMGIWKG